MKEANFDFEPSIFSYDLKDIGEGVTISEESYKQLKDLIAEGTSERLKGCSFILVKRYGTIRIVHYSGLDFTKLEPSIDSEDNALTFGSGIYCYNAALHKINMNTRGHIYSGIYTGYYYECVFDEEEHLNDDNSSDKGLAREVVIKSTTVIPVTKIK